MKKLMTVFLAGLVLMLINTAAAADNSLPNLTAYLYAITPDGTLQWRRYDGNRNGTLSEPVDVDTGWGDFIRTVVSHDVQLRIVEKKRQATLANRLPCLDLSRFFEKRGASEAREYMTRYRLLQVFLQRLGGVSEPGAVATGS